VVAALHRAGLVPRILSGTSAGSIVAAFVCVKTDSEMTDILFDDPEQVEER
jgi:TAG lipase/steryl ester hydrolase/phospholipase A2/LPA acyltransferase